MNLAICIVLDAFSLDTCMHAAFNNMIVRVYFCFSLLVCACRYCFQYYNVLNLSVEYGTRSGLHSINSIHYTVGRILQYTARIL